MALPITTIAQGVSSILYSSHKDGFSYCTGVTKVKADNIINLGAFAFANCEKLEEATFLNLEILQAKAFSESRNLKILYLSKKLKTIGIRAFESTAITRINFDGLKSDWEKIEKCEAWNEHCNEFKVVCRDGTITIPAYTE